MVKLLVMNWKMNPATEEEAEKLMTATAEAADSLVSLGEGTNGDPKGPEVVVCPPFQYLRTLEALRGTVSLGAQDVAIEPGVGAYTGEVSADMLLDAGVEYVIIGHSERRAAGETDEMVQKKVQAALAEGLTVILCVGEPREKRDRGADVAQAFVFTQLESDLSGISAADAGNVIIAYEPIWAISTSKDAVPCTPAMAVVMMQAIQAFLKAKFGVSLPTLYGGSVTSANIESFLREKAIHGALVGGASVKVAEISAIINASCKNEI